MGVRVPFTKRERQQIAQSGNGYRPVNNWGGGDLPAPWAQGDVVEITADTVVDADLALWIGRYPPGENASMNDPRKVNMAGFYCLSYVCSIDDGDAWYCRVESDDGYGSDRLHIAYAARSNWDHDCDNMAPFRLVDTADPDGLRTRQEMLAAGWPTADQFTADVHCPTCGQICGPGSQALDRVQTAAAEVDA